MKEISLDFRIARRESSDRILQSIAKESLGFLLRHVNQRAIKGILLTGSVANGEGTVIQQGAASIASDFDFVVYMNLLGFLRNRRRLQTLSQEITARLVQGGVNTHVNFTPSTDILQVVFQFEDQGIYEYEFAHASKTLFGKSPIFAEAVRPDKKDALELTFTVVNELFFANIRRLSEIGESYEYAKRALTLLNSLLIFHGIFAKTYEERMRIAQEHAATDNIPISKDELEMLQVLTEFKLSGSLQDLLDALDCKKIGELVCIQRDFLRQFTTKILIHELTNFDGELAEHSSGQRSGLISNYLRHSQERFFHRFLGVALYVLWTFSRDPGRKEIFSTYLFYRQSPKTILNAVVTLLFLHPERIEIKKVLKEVFPWINLSEAAPTEKLSSLWQSAEQSVKFD